MISTVTVEAHKNPEYNTDSGNAVQDKVFILSVEEANRYFKNEEERQVISRERWWLRTTGSNSTFAAVVSYDGTIDAGGFRVDNTKVYVRPAMWIDINA